VAGEITYEDTIALADSATDLRLMIKLGADNNPGKMHSLGGKLSMQEDEIDKRPGHGGGVGGVRRR
jgi:twitching motility protein PilU